LVLQAGVAVASGVQGRSVKQVRDGQNKNRWRIVTTLSADQQPLDYTNNFKKNGSPG